VGPNQGVFVGLVRNLRGARSLSSVTDQFWIRLPPVDSVARLGRIPVADFGPLYPTLVAIVPAPLDAAFLVVHVVAVFVAVWSVGVLALRATGSTLAGAAAQVLALCGPSVASLFFPEGRPLDLFGMVGSDGIAVACFLAALAMLTVSESSTSLPTVRGNDNQSGHVREQLVAVRSRGVAGVAGGALLAAAMLTRYATAGAVLGVLTVLLWSRRSNGARRWMPVVAALAVVVMWQAAVYPLLVDGVGPKGVALHRGSIGPLGQTIAGWVGLTVGTTVGTAVVIVSSARSLPPQSWPAPVASWPCWRPGRPASSS
jgi:hypothetical protein